MATKPMNARQRLRKSAAWLRHWLADDWEAKLVALVLGFLVWYVIKDNKAREVKMPPDGWNMVPTQTQR
jgi:hypothetical protein